MAIGIGRTRFTRTLMNPHMKLQPKDIHQELFADIPRGDSERYLRDQYMPQARYMSVPEVMTSPLLAYDPKNPGDKLLIGRNGRQLLGISDNRHILSVAGSRAGKSVAVINNLLLTPSSIFAIDAKNELSNRTAGARAKMGQKIVVMDAYNMAKGDARHYRGGYNPMTTVQIADPYAIEKALVITDGMVVREAGEKDPHWNESAFNILNALVLYTAVCGGVRDEDRHLITLRWLVRNALKTETIEGPDGKPIKRYMIRHIILSSLPQLREQGRDDLADAIEGGIEGFYNKPENERGSVLSTAERHTTFLDYKGMREVLTRHDFDMRDLKANPDGVTVYACLPARYTKKCSRWLRILLNQFLEAVEIEQTKPRAPVRVILDEFPVLGYMDQLQTAIGHVAGFDCQLWVILQDWGQGEALYKERWESFASNAGITIFFGNVDKKTTEYISQRLGKTTVQTSRLGEAGSDQRSQGITGASDGIELYDLATPDEVRRLFGRDHPMQRQLVLWGDKHPIIAQRVHYWDSESEYHAVFRNK